jgi:L-threonylcarbamoyladenylate synthase
VLSELGEFLEPGRDYILEGGSSSVGVESTIIDCTTDEPHILRPGAVTKEQIETLTGLEVVEGGTTRAPGTLPAHYAPNAVVLLVDAPDVANAPAGSGLIAPTHVPTPTGVIRLAAPADTNAYGRELYAALRAGDDQGLAGIVVVPPSAEGLGLAIRDRLRRAAYGSGGAE